jgi:hypothetical protein
VVARGKDVDAHEKELVGDVRRNAETAGSVLAVRDNEIGLVGIGQAFEVLPDELPARLADDVADEEDFQETLQTIRRQMSDDRLDKNQLSAV